LLRWRLAVVVVVVVGVDAGVAHSHSAGCCCNFSPHLIYLALYTSQTTYDISTSMYTILCRIKFFFLLPLLVSQAMLFSLSFLCVCVCEVSHRSCWLWLLDFGGRNCFCSSLCFCFCLFATCISWIESRPVGVLVSQQQKQLKQQQQRQQER